MFQAILTTLGIAQIANAVATAGQVAITHMAIGDGNGVAVTPSPSQTALVREVFRAPINRIARLGDAVVEVELVVPSASGGWTMREIGAFDSDGGLIAVASAAPIYKPIVAENSIGELVVVIRMVVANASAVSITVDGAGYVLATRQWVADNYSLAALIPGGTTGQRMAKASNADGHVHWVDPDVFDPIVGIIAEEQELAAAQAVVTLATATTASLAVYVDGLRLRESEYTIDSATQITLGTPAVGGEHIHLVQNDPTGRDEYLHADANLGDVPDKAAARAALQVPAASATLLKADNLAGIANPSAARSAIGAAADVEVLKKASNLSDVPDKAAARAALGVPSSGQVLFASSNLGDVPNKEVARVNLGVVEPETMLVLVLDMLYPVGALVVTMQSGSPDTWSGAWSGFGTWARVAKGRALVGLDPDAAAYDTIGATLGAAEVTLLESQMPIHQHRIPVRSDGGGAATAFGTSTTNGPYVDYKDADGAMPYTSTAGGGQPHSNIPPSMVVAVWHRVA